MTTFADSRHDHDVAPGAEEDLVTSVSDFLREAGSGGVRLNTVMDRFIADGHAVPSLSNVLTQLIRENRIVLTPDRRFRWTVTQ